MCRMCDDPAHIEAGRTKSTDRLALGLDFGTESVRAILVDLFGHEHAVAVAPFAHGQIVERLPGQDTLLPEDYALQHSADWRSAAIAAVKEAMEYAGALPKNVISIGVDFTSCTILCCKADGTPLHELPSFKNRPHAWPKLWKHHGAKAATAAIQKAAQKAKAPWLSRYGGIVGLEWLFPKMLEIATEDDEVWNAADLIVEAGDYFVWQLVGGHPGELVRSTCQAGYKGFWSAADAERKPKSGGYPDQKLLRKISPRLADVCPDKLWGRHMAPGGRAGVLSEKAARAFRLAPGTPVSAAIIDAHAGVIGAGVAEPDTLVMVMGTSSCHMLMSKKERFVPGIAGIVRDGILPGYVGYETGQAAVGDAFLWISRTTGKSLDELAAAAADLSPGAGGVIALDWLNGCRTPLMDGSLRGAFAGLTLATRPEHLYAALIEATAFGVRWIIETLKKGDVPIKRLVATGGIAHANPSLMQTYADILGKKITVHPGRQGPALGAAVLGAVAAGKEVTGFSTLEAAVLSMTRSELPSPIYEPRKDRKKLYDQLYDRYRRLAGAVQKNNFSAV